jgi:hypothetical protein
MDVALARGGRGVALARGAAVVAGIGVDRSTKGVAVRRGVRVADGASVAFGVAEGGRGVAVGTGGSVGADGRAGMHAVRATINPNNKKPKRICIWNLKDGDDLGRTTIGLMQV